MFFPEFHWYLSLVFIYIIIWIFYGKISAGIDRYSFRPQYHYTNWHFKFYFKQYFITLCVWICTLCVSLVSGSQKRALDPCDWCYNMVMSHHVGVKNRPWVLCKSNFPNWHVVFVVSSIKYTLETQWNMVYYTGLYLIFIILY